MSKDRLKLPQQEREVLIREIQVFFKNERDEDIGNLGAMILLDFIIEKIAPAFYNMGVKDSIKYLNERLEDMYALEI